WFADVIEGFFAHRRRRRFERAVRRHDDHRQVGPLAAQVTQHVEPRGGAEFEVEQDGVERLLLTQLHRLRAAHREAGGVTLDLDQALRDRAEIRVVINYQHSALMSCGHIFPEFSQGCSVRNRNVPRRFSKCKQTPVGGAWWIMSLTPARAKPSDGRQEKTGRTVTTEQTAIPSR